MKTVKSKTTTENLVGVDPTTRLTAWALLALTLLLDAGILALMISTAFFSWDASREWGFGGPSQYAQLVILTIEPLVAAGLGMTILFRSGNRRMGWLMMSIGFLGSLAGFSEVHATIAFGLQPQAVMPLKWPAAWLVRWIWLVWLTLLAVVMPQIFPTGTPLEGRWRRLFQGTVLYMAAATAVLALARMPLSDPSAGVEIPNPLGLIPIAGEIMFPALMIPLLSFAVLGIISLGVRFRRSRGEERQQIKWIFYALALLVLSYWIFQGLQNLAGDRDSSFWSLLGITLWRLGRFGLPLAVGFSILKYRLYDIDLLVNRTLVYGALTAIIVAVYAFFVAGVGTLLPIQGNLFFSFLATGVIAVLFNPVRERLQRTINRLMFGERDDPYAVLSRLGQQLQETSVPDHTLSIITSSICQALKLPYAAIQLLTAEGDRQTAAATGQSSTTLEEWPLVYQGHTVGWLAVAPRSPGEAFSNRERRLLADIAAQAGAAAYSVRLTRALQRSRESLVLAREEERRRIRRDLHDGLGPSLASQTFKLDAALELMEQDSQTAAQLLTSLKAQNQRLVADIRRLVYELRPPTLDELGLSGALDAHARQLNNPKQLKITILAKPEPLPVLPAAVEVAAYRIALEGITNVVRHAHAQECTVMLEAEKSQLMLTVSDDGVGLPPEIGPGVGLASMRERAEELGGSIEIVTRQANGTRVTAVLPVAGSKERSRQTVRDDLPSVANIISEAAGLKK